MLNIITLKTLVINYLTYPSKKVFIFVLIVAFYNTMSQMVSSHLPRSRGKVEFKQK